MPTHSLPAPATGSPGFIGWALGLSWFGIMSAGPVAFWGAEQLFAQPPAFLAMLAAVASFPAIGLMMIAGAWRTSWMTAQRLDAAIAALGDEIRRRGDDPDGGGPRAKPMIDVAPPTKAGVRTASSSGKPAPAKPARARSSREPIAPAIRGFADDAPPKVKTPQRPKRETALAASAKPARKTAPTAAKAVSPAKKPAHPAARRPMAPPAIEVIDAVPETAMPPRAVAPKSAPRPPVIEPRPVAERADAPPPVIDRNARRAPPAPPPIADLPMDALALQAATQRAVVDLTAMRRRRRAMRMGA